MPESPDIYTTKRAWGLEYIIEAGSLPYEVVWSINTDVEVATMFANGGIPQVLLGDDEVNILDTCDHLPHAIANASYIAGRSIVIPASEQCIQMAGTRYNAIQISGWGYNQIVNSNNRGLAEATPAVFLPRDDQNYRDIRSNATSTTYLEGGKMIQQARDYLFPGAYTEEEVIKKVGSELALWNLLTNNGTNWDIPFHMPIPLLVGRYSGLVDPKGRPAYFYASLVPYSGMRDGILFNRSQDTMYSILDNSPRIGGAFSVLHQTGLAHNQLGLGNFSTIYAVRGQKPLVADMATISALDRTPIENPLTNRPLRNYGRAHDLFSALDDILYIVNVPRDEGLLLLQMVLSDMLINYGAFNERNARKFEELTKQMLKDPDHGDFYVAQFLDDAEDAGILHVQPNIEQVQRHSLNVLNTHRTGCDKILEFSLHLF